MIREVRQLAGELEQQRHPVRFAESAEVVDDLGESGRQAHRCAEPEFEPGGEPGSVPTAIGTRTALPHSVHEPS